MDAAAVALLREVLASTVWVDRTRDFARSLRRSTTQPHGVLLVGTPDHEPWHLAAHLDDESRWSGAVELAPTLVRWSPPIGAPAHLAIGLQRIEAARRGESLLVVAAETVPPQLLERISDARRTGATVFALDTGDRDLQGLAHDVITAPVDTGPGATWTGGTDAPGVSLDAVQHLVSVAVGESGLDPLGHRRGLRDRLARLLDAVSGPPPERY